MSQHRKPMIAKVKIGQKQLGWDDDFYRDVLAGRYGGKRSATKLTDSELVDLLEHMKASGFRPRPGKRRAAAARVPEMSGKIRALWQACWDLGVVDNPRGDALAAFIRRQTGVDSPAWMDGAAATKVIEGLKAMAARDGGVDWAERDNPRLCVVLAQWRRLCGLGVLRNPTLSALDEWLILKVAPHQTSVELLDYAQLDNAQARLGAWLRRELVPGGRE